MPTTTSVSFADLAAQYDSELDDYREAYDELREVGRDRYGEGWLDDPVQPTEQDIEEGTDTAEQYRLQRAAQQYARAAENTEEMQHAIDAFGDRYDGDTFEVAALTGSETIEMEMELRTLANQQDIDSDLVEVKRKELLVNAATVDAPEGVPTDDEGSPRPSECEQRIMFALADYISAYNSAGDVDFTAAGFDAEPRPAPGASSATPTDSATSSAPSPPTDDAPPSRGDS